MIAASRKLAAECGLRQIPEGLFFTSFGEAAAASVENPLLRGQIHHMRRAFDLLEVDGILCIDNKPTAFFRVEDLPVDKCFVNRLQKKAWNQNSATLLVILDPTRVYLFSCLTPPEDESTTEIGDHQAFITELDRAADVLESFRLAERLASGSLYRRHQNAFNSRQAVDRYLVRNLEALSEQILGRRSRQRLPAIHAFLGRIIFTAYLLDRKVIYLSDYIRRKHTASFHDFLENVEEEKVVGFLFEKLFPALRREFNGSMFGTEFDEERKLIGKREIRLLKTFFRGDDLGGKQATLGFWAYDFSIIPVEVISAIYEKFLGLEDHNEKERKGAYYTPKNLAEMTVAEALQGSKDLTSMRFLDPSCGSGVFLVVLFHYLAEEWSIENPNAAVSKKMSALIGFFTENLRGIDVNETACLLTCFSLYIALLDQFDPPTLRTLKEKVGKGRHKPLLPPIFAGRHDSEKVRESRAILHADFFDEEIPLSGKFDFIIGNPPWVSRGGSIPNAISDWVYSEDNPFREKVGTSKAKLNEALIPQKQIAHAFLWKSILHLREGGQGCLILPSQLLTNRTDGFQRHWFSSFETERVIHLADFRRFLFDNAIRPCLIFHFKYGEPEASSTFEYAVPKVTGLEPRSGLIPVCADDRKWIRLEEILEASQRGEAATIWKTRMWASPSDVLLLDGLKTLPKLSDHAGRPAEGKRWSKGKGFQPWYDAAVESGSSGYGEPKPIPGRLSDTCIRKGALGDFFVLSSDCTTLGKRIDEFLYPPSRHLADESRRASKKQFRRAPAKDLLGPPVLLINKGFTRFALSTKKVFFRDSVTGISGPKADSDVLYFLSAYLHSQLAEYYIFHLASSVGVERPEVRVHEILTIPFPLPEHCYNERASKNILEKSRREIDRIKQDLENRINEEKKGSLSLSSASREDDRIHAVSGFLALLNPLVFQYFDLSEEDIAIIEDTVTVYRPSATPETPDKEIPTTRPVSNDDLVLYCEWLSRALNRWSSASQWSAKSPRRFRAEFGIIQNFDLALVILRRAKSESKPRKVTSDSKLNEALGRLADSSREEVGPFEYLRGILHGTPDDIYLAKPALRGHWTRTRALDDARNVFGAIVEGGGDHKG